MYRTRRGQLLAISSLAAACLHCVRWEGPGSARPICNVSRVIAQLDVQPQRGLRWIDRKLAMLTTPFKRRGIKGWRETYCIGDAVGQLVRNAQHSSDDFWTMDLALRSFRVDTVGILPNGRYLRIEVEPRTPAHDVANRTKPTRGSWVHVAGVIVIDTDRDFLEIHPDSVFAIVDSTEVAGH